VNIADFSPASQDKVAEWLIGSSHALDLVRKGKLERAIAPLNKTWVSLPGESQQAHGPTMQTLKNLFDRYVKEGSR
jgi:muramidase (phage lysozyme)